MNYIETIKCADMEVFHIQYHQNRISRTIGKNISLLDFIYPPNNKLLKCKIIYDKEKIIDVVFNEYHKKKIQTLQIIHDDIINYKYKYEDREQINKLLLNKEDANDIIIIKEGLITDTSIANIAVFIDKQWFTPLKPLLMGTTRQRYIDNGKLKEIDISIEMIKKAEKIALLNAMIDFDIIDDLNILF